jgi:hypothetical protein
MQNTIVKEFENNPDVVTFVYNQGGIFGETRDWLETFWENYYLRGAVVFDETGFTAVTDYGQPMTDLPFSRGFIIDQDGKVALPYFGHHPKMVIEKIYELLGTTRVEQEHLRIAPAVRLYQNHPNPFRSMTTIALVIPEEAQVDLSVFDLAGRRVRTLVDQRLSAGNHALNWDGTDDEGRALPSGIYMSQLVTGEKRAVKKIVLAR